MKIYFAGSIRGGREYSDLYKQIINDLEQYGEVLTEHVGSDEVNELEMNKTDEEIYKQDMSWLMQADVVVADVSMPSLGVGYEIGYAASINKKVLCLYHNKSLFGLSAMINGNKDFDIFRYDKIEDVIIKLKSYFE